MKVSCPACDSKYTIADEKVTGRKVKVRCKSCGGQILVDGTADPATDSEDNDATKVFTSEERNAFDAEHGGVVSADSIVPGAANGSPAASPSIGDTQSTDLIWSVNVSETEERSLNTAELVSAYMAGELDGEVYVWHDGMADWTLILDVPELSKAIDAKKAGAQPQHAKPGSGATESSTPINPRPDAGTAGPGSEKKSEKTPSPGAAQQKKSLPTAGRGPGFATAKAGAADRKPEEKKTAARAASAKRPQSAHDLFSAASQSAEDVDISVSQEDEAEQKKTGARNESSVLFSLDALKAGMVGTSSQAAPTRAAPGKKAAPSAPKKKLEDLMNNTSGGPSFAGPGPGTLMLSSNQALLTAPAPPPPKPEPKPVVAAPVAAGGASTGPIAAAATSIPAPPKKKGIIIGLVAVAALAAVGGIAVVLTGGGSTNKTFASATVSTAQPAPTPEPAKTEPAPAETKPAEPVASATAAPTTSAVPTAVAANNPATPKSGGTPASGQSKPAEPKKETKKEEPSGPVSSGVASFNKDSAIQALSVAASQASSCKQPDGPTGTGKVQVTFAPSGRATTAVITGGSFGGTPVGGCVSNVFKRARVPPFAGDPVTVSKSFSIIP